MLLARLEVIAVMCLDVQLLQLNADIFTRIEWCLANQANLRAEHHCLPLQKLYTAWSLPALHSRQKLTNASFSSSLDYSPFPVFCTSGESYSKVLPTALTGAGPHWTLPWDTVGPRGDSCLHSQKVSAPQGCGQVQEGTTGHVFQQTVSPELWFTEVKPDLILSKVN